MNIPRLPLTVLESPYRGWGATREEIAHNVELNLTYARLCLRDSIQRGESPIASHLLYTQPHVLDDSKPEERKLGLMCGLLWIPACDYGIFYTDRGWSSGMLESLIDVYLDIGFNFRLRSLEGKSAIRLPTPALCDSALATKIIPFCEE